MKKVYVAGSLFKDGDIKERKSEGKILRDLGMDVFNPIEQPFNENKNEVPTAAEIFKKDTKAILESNAIFAEYDGEDAGVMAELGITWAVNYFRKYFESGKTAFDFLKEFPKKNIVVHSTDIRQPSSNKYSGHHVPYGLNQYVIGMIEDQGKVFTDKEEAFKKIEKG